MERHLGATLVEQIHKTVTRRLLIVGDVRLVGQTQHQDPAPLHGLTELVQGTGDPLHHVFGHRVLISPASSMNRVYAPYSRAFHVR